MSEYLADEYLVDLYPCRFKRERERERETFSRTKPREIFLHTIFL